MKFTFCNFENMTIETHYISLSELLPMYREMRQINKYHCMSLNNFYSEFKSNVALSIMLLKK